MLDCPEPTQTSPTRTSLMMIGLEPAPAIFSSSAPPAVTGSSLSDHLPCWSDVADFLCPRNVTSTFSPAPAVPQTGTGTSLWRTIWSLNIGGSVTAAAAGDAAHTNSSADTVLVTRRE